MKIKPGICHQFLRSLHKLKHCICNQKSDHSHHKSCHNTKCIRCMKCLIQVLLIFRPVKLRHDHGRTGRQSDKNFHDQVHNLVYRTADSRQSFLTYKTTDNNAVGRVIYLLKKCPDHDRKKEDQKLFPDHTFRNLILLIHLHNSPISYSFKSIRFLILILVSIAEGNGKSNVFLPLRRIRQYDLRI